jgi:hypothetical protein
MRAWAQLLLPLLALPVWGLVPAPVIGGVSVVNGSLLLDGRPLPAQRVLLISGEMTALLASATTNEDGDFELDVPKDARQGSVHLLVKIQGPVVGLVHRTVDLADDGDDLEIRIDTNRGAFHTVSGTVATTKGWPPSLDIFVNPVQVEGVPAELARFFFRRDERVVESTFFKTRLAGQTREFALTLAAGTYRIGGGHLNYNRPNLADPDFENYTVARVEADGDPDPLPGNPSSGYELDVGRDRRITMTIEVVPDEALSPGGL